MSPEWFIPILVIGIFILIGILLFKIPPQSDPNTEFWEEVLPALLLEVGYTKKPKRAYDIKTRKVSRRLHGKPV